MPDDQQDGTNNINPFKRPDESLDNDQPATSSDPTPADTVETFSISDGTDADSTALEAEPMETTDSSSTDVSPEVQATDPSPTPEPTPAPMPAFETEPATQPVDMPAMSGTTFAQPETPKKSKKGLIIGGVIAVFLVLGLGGSVAAYNLWYQNPDKVLVDSVVNAIKAKSSKVSGTFTWQNDDASLTITPTFQANESAGAVKATVKFSSKSEETKMLDGATIDADIVFQKSGTVYFRLANLKENFDKTADALVEEQIKQYEASGMSMTDEEKAQAEQMIKGMYQPFVEKLDNQWIKVEADKKTDSSDERKCFSDAYAKFSSDELANEVGDVYKQHRFVTVKDQLEDRDGSMGYELELDELEAKEFGKAFEKTKIGKELAKCDENANTDTFSSENNDDDFKSSSFKVWISRWGHELTHVSFDATLKDESAGSFKGEFDTEFNKDVDITVPKGAKSFDEIFEGFDPFGLNSTEATAEQIEV